MHRDPIFLKSCKFFYPPMAFTEQGVAMLSTVLNSEKAIYRLISGA